MANTLLDLHSGSIRLYDTISHYEQDNVTYDIVVVVNSYNQLILYVVHRDTTSLYKRISLPYLSKSIKLLKTLYPFASQTTMDLIKVFGIHNDETNHVTIFLKMYHRLRKTNFLMQLDMGNFDTGTIDITPVHNLLNTTNMILGVMSKKDVAFTDDKTISIKDTYIMIVNTEDSFDIGGKKVEGIRVLMNDTEKEEFVNKFPDITLIDTTNPIVDVWNEKRYRFYNLPKDTTSINISFSTGMAIIDLN